jgi:glycosyltransferase involved in cell wall biosynthesis
MPFDSAIVIPCYNERARLPDFWRELRDANPRSWVIAVEDGSTDRLEVPEDERSRVLSYPENRGKGHAVRFGWNWVLEHCPEVRMLAFCDADGAVPAREVARLLDLFRASDGDALLGSRICMLGKEVRRNPFRHYLGRCFATYLSLRLDLPAYDTQCGCKLLRAHAYRAVAGGLRVDGFSFDVELILRLRERGFRLREEPVDWQEKGGSKVSVWRDSWRMLGEINRLRKAVHGS